MANYTAADIKALRERTGAGMLDVKKALDEADGDSAKALEIIRIKGLQGVANREGRETSEGLVLAEVIEQGDQEVGVLIELNSETDFVAKNEKFLELANNVLAAAVASGKDNAEDVLAAPAGEGTVGELIDSTAAILGEKVVLRRVGRIAAQKVASYLHKPNKDLPPQVGVLVGLTGEDVETGREIAMHITAMTPEYLSRDDVPAEVIEAEKRVATEILRQEGKPENIWDKIIEGRLTGFYKANVLLEQPYSRDNKVLISKLAEQAGIELTEFVRFRVGA